MAMSRNSGVDGVNMQSIWQSEAAPERPLFWHYPHYANQGGNPGSVIRLGQYKLIHDFETGALELYDLSEDLSETNDLSDELPEVRDRLYQLLEEWRTTNDVAMMTTPNPDWNSEEPVVE
jgi:arylsulfatase A-like enzyme